jgi:hypothetical protein
MHMLYVDECGIEDLSSGTSLFVWGGYCTCRTCKAYGRGAKRASAR